MNLFAVYCDKTKRQESKILECKGHNTNRAQKTNCAF